MCESGLDFSVLSKAFPARFPNDRLRIPLRILPAHSRLASLNVRGFDRQTLPNSGEASHLEIKLSRFLGLSRKS